ncbi:hypothetical protein BWQ96_09457 [Gracilariopsis chorda]|uniref:Uncharacterized protein n=1 Tax=Gracilariopsis chorda TaxID=448386 RepID=A0A2V3IFC5_9FLOR|nr:hypothetical protein BWQ96_09457 [Gracilariopsis chorda]|eukprot:PXF40799.1 hypothetical protein BWQ96_09457 [Gracilariopsis chorda]
MPSIWQQSHNSSYWSLAAIIATQDPAANKTTTKHPNNTNAPYEGINVRSKNAKNCVPSKAIKDTRALDSEPILV